MVLQAANNLHPNLQFTLETPSENAELAFVDNNTNVEGNK